MDTVESRIDTILTSIGTEQNLAGALVDIPEIPIKDFGAFQQEMREKTAQVLIRKPYNFKTFKLVAAENFFHYYCLGLILVGIAVFGSFFHNSWVVGVGILFAMLGFSFSSRVLAIIFWPVLAYGITFLLPSKFYIDVKLLVSLTVFAAIGGFLTQIVYALGLMHRALRSEKVFSFLFTSKKIAITLKDRGFFFRN